MSEEFKNPFKRTGRPKKVETPDLPEADPNLYEKNWERCQKLCKLAYLSGESPKRIAASYGIPIHTLLSCIYQRKGAWRKIRERIDRETHRAVFKSKKQSLEAVYGLSLELMKRELTKELKHERRLSIEEIQKLGSLLSDVDKPIRLDNQQATDIIHKVDNTREGIKNLLAELAEADPYVEYSNLNEKPKDVLQ